tara:strand:+ start:297 stop:1040 length:744 start_codon:yes stop_codon:yes gene_type:complete
MRSQPQNELTKGNVLFIILLAVALFAALTYAVTRGERGGVVDITAEKAETISAQIIQFTSLVETAMTRLKLSNGCSPNQISFNYDSDADGNFMDAGDLYNNTSSPTDLSCHIFHPSGGGIAYIEPADEWLDSTQSAEGMYGEWVFTAANTVENIGLDANADMVVLLPYLNREVCVQINDKLGVASAPANPPAEGSNIDMTRYAGTVSSSPSAIWDTSADGREAACLTASDTTPASGSYFLYHVLEPR